MTHRFFRFVPLALAAAAAAGCGPNLEKACENYVDAWGSCIDEAFAADAAALDEAKAQLEGTCTAYEDVKGDAADEAAEILDCYTDALDGGDCGDPASYAATLLDVASCSGPLGLL